MPVANKHNPTPTPDPSGRRRLSSGRQAAVQRSDNLADARRRDAMRAARRHTGRVRFLKFALPISGALIAIALVAIVLFANYGSGLDIANYSLDTDGVVMNNPRLSGHDGKNRSYEVKAKRAVQSLINPHLITLEEVSARIDLAGKDWATFAAERGRYDRAQESLELDQGIIIKSGSGYRVNLHTARIDLKSGTMSSQDDVVISSPAGSISAKSVQMHDQGQRIVFKGKVRMRILPSQLGTKANK